MPKPSILDKLSALKFHIKSDLLEQAANVTVTMCEPTLVTGMKK